MNPAPDFSAVVAPGRPHCQGCGSALTRTLVDLGAQPLANAFLRADSRPGDEPVYPLHAWVCDRCLLVQVDPMVAPDVLFADYPYFSSYSDSWLDHCRRYVDAMIERFGLDAGSKVVEIASNDGYLLQYFLARNIPALGVEPAENVARAAMARGVPVDIAFFGEATAQRLAASGWQADLVVAKNVLAHVPDIHDFVKGVRILLKQTGVFTVEFPHLLNLLRDVQFDTIYHEHFTYLSLLALRTILERNGLLLFDVEKQPTHGGSLRVFAARAQSGRRPSARVAGLVDEEVAAGLDRGAGYDGFADRVRQACDGLVAFLAGARGAGATVVAYGAAAKGNTLLNACGVTAADIPFVVDRNPAKQGKLLPGSRIPVRPVEALLEARPQYVLILPWNLREEIIAGLAAVPAWGGRFVTAIPRLRIANGAD